jgi:glycosyltransferase involved in cell wall biosynthesis
VDVAAISSFTARELVAATGITPRVIPYGVSLPDSKQEWPVEHGLVLTVGRLIARKGHSYLVEAMALLRDRPGVKLVIVGEGHERPNLEGLIAQLRLEDRVRLAGRIPGEELEHLYATCHLFVLPAIVDETGDTEMLGMVLLEAMRYRKPVIATSVGGTTDIVRDDETGILVPQRDPQALAGAIDRLLDEPERAELLGRAGYAYARDRFSWEAVLNQTLAFYGLAPAELHRLLLSDQP